MSEAGQIVREIAQSLRSHEARMAALLDAAKAALTRDLPPAQQRAQLADPMQPAVALAAIAAWTEALCRACGASVATGYTVAGLLARGLEAEWVSGDGLTQETPGAAPSPHNEESPVS